MAQLWKALAHLYPQAQPLVDYIIADRGGVQSIAAWNLPQPVPTEAELAAASDAYDAAQATRDSEAATLRQGILTQANAAVGVTYANVTAGMVKALVWILLWKVGALNNDLTIKPLAEWVRNGA